MHINDTKKIKLLGDNIMALITKENKIQKINLKIKINQDIKSEVDAYCIWAGIEDQNHFFSEAAKVVLAKDKDWHQHKIACKKTK